MGDKPRRRWFQFSLRTLLVVVTVLALGLGFVFNRAHRQRAAVAAIRAAGGTVEYFFDRPRYAQAVGVRHELLKTWLGVDMVDRPHFIHLDDPHCTDETCRHVAQCGWVNLQVFINTPNITDRGVQHLAGMELLYLDLNSPNITDMSVPVLESMHELIELGVCGTQITPEAFFKFKGLNRLLNLDLVNMPLEDEHLAILGRLNVYNLVLIQNQNQITDAGLESLAKSTTMMSLYINDNRIEGSGLRHLVGVKGLYLIGLMGTDIDDAALKHLAEIKTLQRIYLNNTSITDAGLKHLETLPILGTLTLTGTRVTSKGVAEFQKANPACRIVQ